MHRSNRGLFLSILAGALTFVIIVNMTKDKQTNPEYAAMDMSNSHIGIMADAKNILPPPPETKIALGTDLWGRWEQPPSPKRIKDIVGEVDGLLPPCPERSPFIEKHIRKSVQNNPSVASLERVFCYEVQDQFPPIQMGGVYRPSDCKAKQRVAIIVPYRNRYEHLHIQLQNLYPVLRRQQADFRFFIIEQEMPTTFNQGMLFNIGFLEADKYDNFDCFIFSDVDLLPLNDEAFYLCDPDNPVQITGGISKWKYSLPFDNYYGGIVAFTKEQFRKINGFSNLYFGWGGVDNDLLLRVKNKGYKKVRYARELGIFDMIKHKKDHGNFKNVDRKKLLSNARGRQNEEGVNSAVYTMSKVEIKPLYTWMHVNINMTHVVQKVPESTKKYIGSLYEDAKIFDVMVKTGQAHHLRAPKHRLGGS